MNLTNTHEFLITHITDSGTGSDTFNPRANQQRASLVLWSINADVYK